MIADDFVILFVSGYIFEDLEFILKNMPEVDFTMTVISEQINPLNAIFIVMVLNYFARISGDYDEEEEEEQEENEGQRETMMMLDTEIRMTDINLTGD